MISERSERSRQQHQNRPAAVYKGERITDLPVEQQPARHHGGLEDSPIRSVRGGGDAGHLQLRVRSRGESPPVAATAVATIALYYSRGAFVPARPIRLKSDDFQARRLSVLKYPYTRYVLLPLLLYPSLLPGCLVHVTRCERILVYIYCCSRAAAAVSRPRS